MTRRLDLPDTTLHLHARGEGPVALFVHGFPLDGTLWLDQLEALAGTRRCVAPDLRGFGRSEATARAVLTMEQHADDLAGVLDGLGVERADVVGLSMGGYVALAFAERHPGRLRSLALVDTRAGADGEAARAGREAMADRVVEQGRAALVEALAPALLAPGASRQARARLRSMIEGTPVETIVAALLGMKERPDRGAVLGGIAVPAAVIVGALDTLTPPAEAQAMAAAIPGATLHVVEGSGHLTPIERPEAVSAALVALFARAG